MIVVEVVLYTAHGCHLCERARSTLEEARVELGFDLREVDIGGDPELEARYREWLPVVEIGGKRAFVYHVDAAALARKVAKHGGTPGSPVRPPPCERERPSGADGAGGG